MTTSPQVPAPSRDHQNPRPGTRQRLPRAIAALALAAAAGIPIASGALAGAAAGAAAGTEAPMNCYDGPCPRNHNEHAARDRRRDGAS